MGIDDMIIALVERDGKGIESIEDELQKHILDIIFKEISESTYRYLIENVDHVETAREVLCVLRYFNAHVTLSGIDYLDTKLDELASMPIEEQQNSLGHILESLVILIGEEKCGELLARVAFHREAADRVIAFIETVLSEKDERLLELFEGHIEDFRESKRLLIEIFGE